MTSESTKKINTLFILVWVVSGFIFGYSAWKIFPSTGIELSHIGIPSYNSDLVLTFNGTDIGKFMEDIATSYNTNITILNTNIKDSARTTFWLDILSMCASVIGLIAQLLSYSVVETGNKNNNIRDSKADNWINRFIKRYYSLGNQSNEQPEKTQSSDS